MASTVVLVRVLADNRDLHTPTGHIAVGWLVVEDLFTVFALVVLPALFDGGGGNVFVAFGVAGLKVAALVAVTAVVGSRVIPWLLEQVAATRSRELFTLTVLVVALGIAVGSAKVFDVSMALGAFLAGMIVGQSEFSLRAAAEALPMRDAFAVLFFVSTGMLFDPSFLLEAPGLVAVTLAIVLLGKPLIALVIVWFLGYPPRVALSVAVALAQIGEFPFILAVLGSELKILPPEATNTLVAAAIVSITLNPLLYRFIGPVERWASRRPRLWRHLIAHVRKQAPADNTVVRNTKAAARVSPHRAVVVGYGPVGQTVSRLLRDNGVVPTVVEMNLETVRRLRAEGIDAVYGDASHRDTLKAAGVDTAGTLVLTASGMHGSEETIRLAREMNPEVRVLARSAYLREASALRKAGAEWVFTAEGEVAVAVTATILRELGATPDQIDRERERVHEELFGNDRPDPTRTAPTPTEAEAPAPPEAPADDNSLLRD